MFIPWPDPVTDEELDAFLEAKTDFKLFPPSTLYYADQTPTILLPNGQEVLFTGRKPSEDLMEAANPIKLFRSEQLIWVKLPEEVRDLDNDFIRSIPGSSFDVKMGMWAVMYNMLDRLLLNLYTHPGLESYWPPTFHPKALRLEGGDMVKRLQELKDIRAGAVEMEIPGYLYHNGMAPRPYQADAARFLVEMGRAILPLPVGAGKSLTILSALKIIMHRGTHYMCPFTGAVLICPASITELVWLREAEKWSDFQISVIEGTPAQRQQRYAPGFDLYVINPELVLRDLKYVKQLVQRTQVLIVDEAQCVSHDTAQITKAVMDLGKDKRWFWLATGTPVMSSLLELLTLVKMVDPHTFRSDLDFKYRYIPRDKNGEWIKHGIQNEEELIRKVAPLMFTRCKITGVPETVPVPIPVELSPSQRKFYNYVRDGAREDLKLYWSVDPAERWKVIGNVFTSLMKMKQICDDLSLVQSSDHLLYSGNSAKLVRLIQLMQEDLLEHKVLIFTQFEQMAFRIYQALVNDKIGVVKLSGSSRPKDRKSAVDSFQDDPETRALVMTTAGGVGLNIQAGTAVVLFDMLWNPKMMDQIVGRVARPGNKCPFVPVIHLMATDSIEQKIYERNQEKSNLFDTLMELENGSKWLHGSASKSTQMSKLVELNQLIGGK